MNTTSPVLSIVIPTYNGRDLLETCLASIERHRPPRVPIETIVSDDGSTDGTVGWLRDRYPLIEVVRREKNGGFVAAANAGLLAARGEFIQLLNNDTEVTAGWVEAALARFDDRTVGAVAPLVLVRSDARRVDSAGDHYAWFGWPTKRGHGERAEHWADRAPEPVFGASGSAAFYRAAALKRVGLFDPLYGSYYEDVDLSFRLRWAGYRCMFAPACRVLHEVSSSYDHGRPELQRRLARNAEILFWSNMPTHLLAAALVPHLGFVACQALWKAARGRIGPFARGKRDAFQLLAEIRARRAQRQSFARSSAERPHFALHGGFGREIRNHLRRPPEASRR